MHLTTEHGERSDDDLRVREWRREQFRHLGFEGLDVELLADSQEVDLGAVRRMLARGCSHDVILRIVL